MRSPVRDNDDIPKITAIDYDGLSECRESVSSIFFVKSFVSLAVLEPQFFNGARPG